jgi:hypothetical protein
MASSATWMAAYGILLEDVAHHRFSARGRTN